MKSERILDKESNYMPLSSIIKAEARKATDTQVARTIIVTTLFLTVAMFLMTIFRYKEAGSWIRPFVAISNPVTTLLAIIFIMLVCEEWTRGTALITYSFVPRRNRVILAKFIVLIIFYIGITVVLFILSALASIISSSMYSYSIIWSQSFASVVLLILPLLINLLFGFSIALVVQETTVALGLYFVIPPITVIASQLPTIGLYCKWFSLEHSSSLFIAGSSEVSALQYMSSIVIWVIIPCILGSIRNMKRDLV